MKRKYKILLGILAVLIVIRLILPYVVLFYANKNLANMKGYYGHIDDVELSLFRGAYIVYDIYINKVDVKTDKQSDFFKAKSIDLSVEWSAILNGSLVGELVAESPVLIFTKNKVELQDVNKDKSGFHKLLIDFMPLKVNRFEVLNGEIHYVDKTAKPTMDIALKQARILASNLTNIKYDNVDLPSTVTAKAEVYEGTLTVDMKLNALKKQPTFDLNAEIKNTNLVLMNDFFKAYANFDVNNGTFGLYTEMAAKGGKIKGYFKPIIKDLDVVGVQDKDDNFFNQIYERIVGAAGVLLRNQKKDQVASKVSFEGDYSDPKKHILDAVFEIFRNAFVQALIPSVDHEINLKSVTTADTGSKGNFIQRIFNPDKNKEEKK